MQTHGTAVAAEPQFDPSPAPRLGTVVGLGVTDVLRIEFQPCQLNGLREEIEARAALLAETYELARRKWLAISRSGEDASPSALTDAELNLAAASYVLGALTALATQLPPTPQPPPLVVVGPTDLLLTLVGAAARRAADALAEQFDGLRQEPTTERLHDLAAAAQAWVQTYADCRAVESYSFDPEWDPVHRV